VRGLSKKNHSKVSYYSNTTTTTTTTTITTNTKYLSCSSAKGRASSLVDDDIEIVICVNEDSPRIVAEKFLAHATAMTGVSDDSSRIFIGPHHQAEIPSYGLATSEQQNSFCFC
jgi:hypothetical protein